MTMDYTKITVTGRLEAALELSHTTPSEAIYKGTVLVPRLSGTVDRVPVHIPGRLYEDAKKAAESEMVIVTGVLRQYSVRDGERSYTRLTLLASYIGGISEGGTASNYVNIVGTISKPPVYRSTPLGREICDLMLAVNRGYDHIDYIPCIAWGGKARAMSNTPVGTRLRIIGRFQSREYEKVLESGETEKRTAFEVSINKLRVASGDSPEAPIPDIEE